MLGFKGRNFDMAMFVEEGKDYLGYAILEQLMQIRNNQADYFLTVTKRDPLSKDVTKYNGVVFISVANHEYLTILSYLEVQDVTLVEMDNYNSKMFVLSKRIQ